MSTKEVATVKSEERSALDEKLLKYARKSINEIAELVPGVPATQIAERLSRLLEDKGWMSERQEERFMLIELGDLISESRERLKRASDEDYAGIAKIVLGAMAQMADRWDKRRKLVEDDIEAITAANARTFGEAYDIAVSNVINSIQTLFPEVKLDDATKYELKRAGLFEADKQLQKKIKD